MDAQTKRLAGLAGLMAAITLGFGAWLLLGGRLRQAELPRLGQAPSFELTSSEKKAYGSQSLAGKVWVASFVYSTCKTACPMLGMQMRRLSSTLPADESFRMVSITVDPDHDTPERLRKYAKDLGADDPRWSFLTGKKAVLKTLINQGFKLAAQPGERVPDERGDMEILHSSKLVLVDPRGEIRGYYDGLLGESVDALKRDIVRLLKDAPARRA